MNGDAARGEPVDVRRYRLRVAAEVADPVLQVVDGDEQDVGLGGLGGERARGEEKREDEEETGGFHGQAETASEQSGCDALCVGRGIQPSKPAISMPPTTKKSTSTAMSRMFDASPLRRTGEDHGTRLFR